MGADIGFLLIAVWNRNPSLELHLYGRRFGSDGRPANSHLDSSVEREVERLRTLKNIRLY